MFTFRVEMKGSIDTDRYEVQAECPRCEFFNPVTLRQARLRDVVICRGCKANLRLDDGMNTVRKVRRNIQRKMTALHDQINRINNLFR